MAETSDEVDFQPIQTGASQNLVGWLASPKRKVVNATIVVVHGLGEHADRYRQLAINLASIGVATLAYDQQGHGRSPGRRGAPRSYDSMLHDIHAALSMATDSCPAKPLFLFGNSMGGNLATSYALRWSHNLAGLLLCAPMLLPAKPPKRDQIFAAWLTGKLLPFIRFHAPTKPHQLTRDESEIRKVLEDPLMHSKISMLLGTQLLAQGRFSLDHAPELRIPVLVLHGDEDTTTDAAASHAFSIRVGDHAKYVNFSDMLHDILHEIDRDQVFSVINDWLQTVLLINKSE